MNDKFLKESLKEEQTEENVKKYGSMKEKKLWELENFKNCKYTNDVNEIIEKIAEGMEFKIKDKFIPGDEIDDIFDYFASRNDIVLSYTDNNHNAFITDENIMMSSSFYNSNKTSIITAFTKYLNEKNPETIYVNNLTFNEEIFNIITNNPHIKTIYFNNVNLTAKQIKRLQENFKDAYLFNKDNGRNQVSTRYAFGYYTKEDLEKSLDISINYDNILTGNYENLCFLPDNAFIRISLPSIDTISEEEKFTNIRKFLDNLDLLNERLNKKLFIKFDVKKRSVFKKVFKKSYQNLNLVICNDYHDYSYFEYMEEEKRLEELVEGIKNANLSPLEKYFAVYNIVKNFKPYKENENDKDAPRRIRYILNNEYMVCVGYAELLTILLDKVGIDANTISVSVDTSYDKGFTLEEKVVEYRGHRRVIVNIDDDKYNVHGMYISDPTWDNNLDENYLNHSLMTFDKMQVSKRMFWLSTCNVILDIHNFDEFNLQVNFLLKRELKRELKDNSFNSSFEKNLLNAYRYVTLSILTSLECNPEMNKFLITLNDCKEEKDYINLLTNLGNYLLKRTNKPIDDKTILSAAREYPRQINDARYLESKDYFQRENEMFPYTTTSKDIELVEKGKTH